jgi:hypothetical protein
MGIPFVVPTGFTGFDCKRLDINQYVVDPSQNLTAFFRSALFRPDEYVTKYLPDFEKICRQELPKKVTLVFRDEHAYEDWWPSVSAILASTVEELTLVNYYGEGWVVEPCIPNLHDLQRLRKLTFRELGSVENFVDGTDFSNLLTAEQIGNIEELEFSGFDIEVVSKLVGSAQFIRLESLVLLDSALAEDVIRLTEKFPALKEFVYGLDENDDEPEKIQGELQKIADAIPNLERFVVQCDEDTEEYVNANLLEKVKISRKYKLPDYVQVFDQ